MAALDKNLLLLDAKQLFAIGEQKRVLPPMPTR
jgi:hypothetical protein